MKGAIELSTSEKTIHPSNKSLNKGAEEPTEDILDKIAGIFPDTGKTAEQYHAERIDEKYF